jgi:glucose-1-phosphate thymidylyltransferase
MFKKGIILAAGRSTRLYPATIVVGKPLLPIFDKPMIYYSLAILMQAQIKEICIVTNPHNLHLFQELLGNGDSWGIHIEYRIQQEAKGIADVFNVAADFIQNQPCALVLGDNIFIGTNWKARFEQIQSQPAYGAHVFARPVSDPERYGVITLDENQKPLDLIEKPNPAPSNLAVTGLYFYDEQASDLAKQLKPSARGELEITDLNRLYLNQQQLHLHQLNQNDDDWFDIGTHDAMYQAIDKISNLIHNTGKQIGCIEEMAYQNGWISEPQLQKLTHRFRHTAYGRYLEQYFSTNIYDD